MTTTAISIPRLSEPGHVTQARAAFAEWTKFISLRSTLWSLGVGVLLTIAFPIIFAAVTASHWATCRSTTEPTVTRSTSRLPV